MAATTAPAPTGGSKELRREVGFIGLLWASTGSVIGSGWLFASQGALNIAGPSAIWSWVIAAVAIGILGLIHAELGAMYPVAGGTARFPHFAFGGGAGASFGWFSWLQAATVAPIEVEAVLTYAGHYSFAQGFLNTDKTLTASGIVVAVLLMAAFVVINLFSVRILANVNSTITWWKVAIPLLTIFVLAIKNFHGGNFTAADGFAPAGMKGIFAAVSTGGIVFALLGFEQADQLAGESKNPAKDLPRAVIGSVIIGGVVYLALQTVFIGALPGTAIPHSWLASKGGFIDFTGPFAQIATAVSVGWLATIIYIDAFISPAGTGLIYTTGSSRVSYGLSRNGYFPNWFEWVTSNRVPWFGAITAFVFGCICFLPFPSWQSLVSLVTSASVLMYAGAPLALGALRARMPDANRPYRLPGAAVMGPLGFAVASELILYAGWTTTWKLGLAILLGYIILIATQVFNLNPIKPQLDLASAIWLPVYLVGMGLIVFFSSFGHTPDNPKLDFGWDMAVAAVFAIVIYFWAVASALPRERIQQMIDEFVVPEDSELAVPAA
jgi:amino acid transporter